MYNRLTDPSSINKQVIPKKKNEIYNREYLDDLNGSNEGKPLVSGFGKAALPLLVAVIVLACLYYLLFEMNLSYQPAKGLEFQVMEYSKKDKILTLKISSGTPLADNYSIESYESNNKDVFIRIRKPLLALRPDKGRSGEDSDSFSITCQIFAELNDNVYFKGTESEEAIYIWSENRVN